MNVYHINQGKKIRNFKLIWWFLLGLFLPYIGFLVSWIFYDGERERAKAILLGAIVSTLVTTLLSYLLPLLLAEGDDKPQDDSSNSGQVIKNLIEI
jgi:H+/Cl- antiporter ClcA